jgi:hypothetical protein
MHSAPGHQILQYGPVWLQYKISQVFQVMMFNSNFESKKHRRQQIGRNCAHPWEDLLDVTSGEDGPYIGDCPARRRH